MNEINHVAIILDGNGRWATKRNLSRSMGHKAGADNLYKLAVFALKQNIKVFSVFAFSTENFKRSKEEVDYLMNLFVDTFKKNKSFFNKNNVKVIFSGRKENLRDDVIDSIMELEESTINNDGGIFNICLNYGGQSEIVDATKKIVSEVVNNNLDINNIDELSYYKYLYNDLPPIDYLIRTSGEERVSNFMLYQLAYSEIYFSPVLFPDFNEQEFLKALELYKNRNRRFGGYNTK